MKKIVILTLLTGAAYWSAQTLQAAERPHGNLLELHSCEVFAGGCTVSSQSTLGGRYMLRVWDFASGAFQGADLKGLQVALLQAASENLAAAKPAGGDAVIYLPQAASPDQRAALKAWLLSETKGLADFKLRQEIVPMSFQRRLTQAQFRAGDLLSVQTTSTESCPTGACGQELWYHPRSSTSVFTVAVNKTSHVREPLLKLTWDDAGTYSVFLGRFGEADRDKNIYVTSADFCGTKGTVF